MMIPAQLIQAFVDLAKGVQIGAVALHRLAEQGERKLELELRQADAVEQSLDNQAYMLRQAAMLADDLEATPDDIKFVADLRSRLERKAYQPTDDEVRDFGRTVAGEAPPPTAAADQGVDHD